MAVDLCIVGAGPAGLAIAHELIGSGFQVLLIERGDVTGPPPADLVSELEVESPHFTFPNGVLHNQLGGMAAIWNSYLLDGATPAARYLPLDPIDFESRHWVPYSGWPITFDEITPYYERARTLCGVVSFNFHGSLPDTRMPLQSPSGALVTRLEQLGPASTFTRQLVGELTTSDHIRVLNNAAAVEVISAEGANDGLATTSVRTHGNRPLTIRSRFVVIAGGAIESARLLLNSKSECPEGLGNRFDNVGRFFMDHPRVMLGRGSFNPQVSARDLDIYEPHILDGQLLLGKLKLSETLLRREKLLNGNAQIFLHYVSISELKRSIRLVVDSIRRRQGLKHVPRRMIEITSDAIRLGQSSLNRHEMPDQRSGGGTGVARRSFHLNYQPEQAPSRANRVTLSQRRDALGYRIARLDWRWSEIDLLSIRKVRQTFASELCAAGLNFAETEEDFFPPSDEADRLAPGTVCHHLGTTRMHNVLRHGVVDRDCRLHGLSSVYVAGASVFPTGGYANPTLTVIALAIRLADDLKRTMSTSR